VEQVFAFQTVVEQRVDKQLCHSLGLKQRAFTPQPAATKYVFEPKLV